jgi:hypothetical protein
MPVHVDWDELQNTFEFVSLEEVGSHEAVLCRKTGKFLWLTEQFDGADEWPDDADDEEKYLAIPHKKELDLGKPLVFAYSGSVATMRGSRTSCTGRKHLSGGTISRTRQPKPPCGNGAKSTT